MPTLDWLNRAEALAAAGKVPYRVLQPVAEYGDGGADNLLIQGDNLDALKALLPFYRGRVKCIFIDPPYNTRSAFTHYDDNLEHSQWLSMMQPRLALLRELLSEDGSLWMTIDDNEAHYLKVLCDEVFGRANFVANCFWQKVYSERMDAKEFSVSHDHIIVYKKSGMFKICQLPKEQNIAQFGFFDAKANKYYRRRSLRKEGSESLRQDRKSMWYAIQAPDGSDIWPVKPDGTEGRWRWKKENVPSNMDKLEFIRKDECWEIYVKQFLEKNPSRPPATFWPNDEVGHNHEAKLEVRVFNARYVFDTPKPERLIKRVMDLATNEGDLILDSFAGSGTTGAVAHKMGRRWIMVEMGAHCQTHIIPRLQKVIDGEQGGISQAVNWQGGGGFRFMRLGEPMFNADGSIHPAVRFDTLASFIWMQETGRAASGPWPSPKLGVHEDCAVYLLFNGILGDKRPKSGNVLTQAVLAEINSRYPHAGPKVIYGEASRLGEKRLAAEGITFKHIPYDVKAR